MKNTRVTKNNLRNVVLTLTLTSVLQSCLLSSSSDKPYAASTANGANSCEARTMAAAMDTDNIQNNDDLFEDVTHLALRSQPENTNNNDQDETQTRQVRINVGQLRQRLLNRSSNNFHLPLLNNKSVNVVLQDVKKYSENNIVATGRIDNDDLSNVTLVINNNVLTANISENGTQESYEIRFAGDGTHTVKSIHDHSEDCLTEEGENALNFAQPLETEAAAQDVTAMDAVPTVDVLVAYAPNALKNVGGVDAMKALIQMGIADSNKAYQNSGANLAIRLVGIMALTQTESTFSSDLSALKGTSDGKWDAVHAERKRVGADLVSVVAYYNSSTAGIGYVGSSFSTGFSITKTTAFKQFSFTHELGHNMGLNHSDGYENSSGKFRTVMAYGTYTRIPRFSNPGFDYNSYATGTTSNNSAKILNASAAKVAAFSVSVGQSENPTNSDPTVPSEPCTDGDTPPIASE